MNEHSTKVVEQEMPDGSRYTGDMFDEKRNGFGISEWNNGQ